MLQSGETRLSEREEEEEEEEEKKEKETEKETECKETSAIDDDNVTIIVLDRHCLNGLNSFYLFMRLF